MVLDGTPFLYPSFLWGATTIGGLVVAMYLSMSAKTDEERRGWTFAFLLLFVLALFSSPFLGLIRP